MDFEKKTRRISRRLTFNVKMMKCAYVPFHLATGANVLDYSRDYSSLNVAFWLREFVVSGLGSLGCPCVNVQRTAA